MAESMIEALLKAKPGERVKIAPDHIILNDGPAWEAIEGVDTVPCADRVTVYYDHDVPAGLSETSAIFEKLWKFSQAHGIRFVQAVGVGYLDMLKQISAGQLVVSGGEHNGIFGAKGAAGIHLDTHDLRKLLSTGEVEVTVPETLTVGVEGVLNEGVSMMDAAFALLSGTEVKGKAIEVICPGLSAVQKQELCAVLCVGAPFTVLCRESGEAVERLELSGVAPMAMQPVESREKQADAAFVSVSGLVGLKPQAGQIGGYTGGTIEHLRLAAKLIEGKRIKYGVRLCVCPATSDDYLKAIDEGIIEAFIRFGAQIQAVGDRSVVVQGAGTVDETETLLTTGLYTFDGCMGIKGSKVYSASVQTVIEAVCNGVIG